jgi:flagellar biosynthesis chaperone FliJ
MLTTIQELEKEIDQFHKNIKDSNALMKLLTSIASLTRTQTESFEVRTKALQDELSKLPPELTDLFQQKIESFVQSVHDEHQAYQAAVTKLMDGYANKFAKAEAALLGVPSALEEQLQKDRSENVAGLKQIQEQYAADLAKTNEAFTKQLQAVVDAIQAVPGQISDNSTQQYNAFLKELDKMMDARLAQLSATEKRVEELSQELEAKYNAFVGKLESTNMDQLYKYCQDMNKSINTKLGIALGGVAIAVIVSIISLFI